MVKEFRDSDSITLHSEAEEDAAFLNAQYQKQDAKRRRQYMLLTLFNLFIFIISMLSIICSVMSQKDSSIHEAAKLMDQFGVFSPAMYTVEYQQQTFEFPKPLNQSKYVGTTADVDTAWKDLAEMPQQMVSLSDFPKLQKPADSLKVTNPKTGETGYRVGLGVFHQLHCVNLLRMASYPEVYGNQSWAMINRVHLDHCIETLRVNLMCTSDVNVFTFHEMPGKEGFQPDYNSPHVCRNFDAIKDWANENAVPNEEGLTM